MGGGMGGVGEGKRDGGGMRGGLSREGGEGLQPPKFGILYTPLDAPFWSGRG